MAAEEVSDYILHRLQLVGWDSDPSFTGKVFERIHKYTNGVPRRVNTFCSRLLLYGFLEELHEINIDVVEAVIADMEGEYPAAGSSTPLPLRGSEGKPQAGKSVLKEMASNGSGNRNRQGDVLERLALLEQYVKSHDRTIKKTLDILATWLDENEQPEIQ